MSRTFHLCLGISGALRMSKKEFRRVFDGSVTRNDGSRMHLEDFRQYLLDEQAKGHKVVPMCDCDNFDHKTGCKGHEQPEEQKAA